MESLFSPELIAWFTSIQTWVGESISFDVVKYFLYAIYILQIALLIIQNRWGVKAWQVFALIGLLFVSALSFFAAYATVQALGDMSLTTFIKTQMHWYDIALPILRLISFVCALLSSMRVLAYFVDPINRPTKFSMRHLLITLVSLAVVFLSYVVTHEISVLIIVGGIALLIQVIYWILIFKRAKQKSHAWLYVLSYPLLFLPYMSEIMMFPALFLVLVVFFFISNNSGGQGIPAFITKDYEYVKFDGQWYRRIHDWGDIIVKETFRDGNEALRNGKWMKKYEWEVPSDVRREIEEQERQYKANKGRK